MTTSFNLVARKWIPVLRSNGRPDQIGLLEALTESTSIREIAAANPIDNVAILRYLVSVVMWCHPAVSTEKLLAALACGGVPADWLGQLGTPQTPNPLFDLFATPRGHLQAPPDRGPKRSTEPPPSRSRDGGADSRNERKPKAGKEDGRPIADLFHEIPGDTNIAHFKHALDGVDGVCPACLALGLVRLPATITAFGTGNRPGINGTPPVYFTPIGRSLLETIALNVFPNDSSGDHPCWAPEYAASSQQAIGCLEGVSWTSRQYTAKLGAKGRCTLCGMESAPLIRRLTSTNLPSGREGLTKAPPDRWCDPHVAYRRSSKPWCGQRADSSPILASRHWREWLNAIQGLHDSSPPLAVVHAMRFTQALSRIDATAMVTDNAKSVECVRICYPPDVIAAPSEGTARLAERALALTHTKRSGLKPPQRPKLPASIAARLKAELPNLEATSFASHAATDRSRSRQSDEAWTVALTRIARSTTTPGLLDVLEAQHRSLDAVSAATNSPIKGRKTGKGGSNAKGPTS